MCRERVTLPNSSKEHSRDHHPIQPIPQQPGRRHRPAKSPQLHLPRLRPPSFHRKRSPRGRQLRPCRRHLRGRPANHPQAGSPGYPAGGPRHPHREPEPGRQGRTQARRRGKEENFRRIERRFGTFVRSFTLPQTVDPDTIKAAYDHGVLKISIAKKAEAKPKQIKVEVGSASSPTRQVEGTSV